MAIASFLFGWPAGVPCACSYWCACSSEEGDRRWCLGGLRSNSLYGRAAPVSSRPSRANHLRASVACLTTFSSAVVAHRAMTNSLEILKVEAERPRCGGVSDSMKPLEHRCSKRAGSPLHPLAQGHAPRDRGIKEANQQRAAVSSLPRVPKRVLPTASLERCCQEQRRQVWSSLSPLHQPALFCPLARSSLLHVLAPSSVPKGTPA